MHRSTTLAIAAAATLTAATLPSTAAVITISSSAPVLDAVDVVQASFDNNDLNRATDFTDATDPAGQTFTTPASSVPLRVNAITVKGKGNGATFTNAGFGGKDLTLQFGTFSSAGVFTAIDVFNDSIPTPFNPNTQGDDYLTFTLDTPLAVEASTQYAFTLKGFNLNDGNYFGLASSSADTLAGGSAFNLARSTRTATSLSYDRTFFVDLQAVPEPSSLLFAVSAGAGLALTRQRRRTARKMP